MLSLRIAIAVLFLLLLIADAKKPPKQVKKEEDLEAVTKGQLEDKLREQMESEVEKIEAAAKEAATDPRELKKQRDAVKKFEKDSVDFAKKAELAKQGFGEFSEERATMLHSLGRAVYKLGRYSEALKHSKGKIS